MGELQLKEGGKAKAADFMSGCSDTRDKCKDEAKERVAKSMGKDGKLSTSEFEKILDDGAKKKTAEAAEACVAVKKDDPDATCEDLTTAYFKAIKKDPPSDAKEKDRVSKRVKDAVSTSIEKSMQQACVDESETKAAFNTCMSGFEKGKDDTMKEIFSGVDDTKLAKKKAYTERKASKELLGETYISCLEADDGDEKS